MAYAFDPLESSDDEGDEFEPSEAVLGVGRSKIIVKTKSRENPTALSFATFHFKVKVKTHTLQELIDRWTTETGIAVSPEIRRKKKFEEIPLTRAGESLKTLQITDGTVLWFLVPPADIPGAMAARAAVRKKVQPVTIKL